MERALKGARILKHGNLEQGSKEWLDAREGCTVTGSDFAAALGLNPYKSRAKLLRQKLKLEPRDAANYFMQFGTDNEPHVANAYDAAFGTSSGIFGFVTYEKDGVKVGCSPDRVLPDRLVEIKCSQRPRFTVETYHLPQLLSQCVFMDMNKVDYVCWSPEQVDEQGNMLLNVATVSFDPRLWTDHVWPELCYFHSLLQRRIAPMVNSSKKKALLEAFTKYTSITKRQ